MAEAFLEVKGVSKRFGENEALRSVDLQVGADELVVVLGPTGAGKTTLLRTIAGLESPEAGTIVMAGRDITGLAPAARDVTLVFQNFSLYPRWTVRENMTFPLKAPGRDLPEEKIAERVEWAAGLLRITRLLDRPSVRLSGGEMQRVAIGRAIVRRPRIFLMDEPLTNLDAKLREELRVEVVSLRRELATPMVFVTHDQVEAMSMGDRIVVLSEGRILQSGSPEEVSRHPRTPEVARQLGRPAINIIEVHRSEGNWVTERGAPLVPVAGTSGAGEVGDRALVGIRPEDIAPDGGAHPGYVRVVEDTGPSKILLVDMSGCAIHILVPTSNAARPGDDVRPRVDPARVVLWPLGG